jgi:translation initiation factor 1
MDLTFNTINDSFKDVINSNKIHLRVQQQGRRYLTIIQDLDNDLDFKRICKDMRKKFSCNGNVVNDTDLGEIIQLQGDQRDNVKEWLLANEILTANSIDRLVIHGF